VDKAKPGDRVEVTGVFRCAGSSQMGFTTGVFKNMIVATGVQNINIEKEKPTMSESDIKNIKKISKDSDLFEMMANSIAPSIEGS